MTEPPLSVYLGRRAARVIGEQGWDPALFSLLLGASGGPKWFVLSHLDRLLFGDFLQRSDRPLATLGSSIGAWRNACLATRDPAAAVGRLEEGYLYQEYPRRPTPAEVSETSLKTLANTLGEGGARELASHPRITTHIVTARGRGPVAADSAPLLAGGMGLAALTNSVSRHLLKPHFQRVVFHSGRQPAPGLSLADFGTAYAPLNEHNVSPALHASGSIPFVLTGERNIPGGPPGQYWDGGIIDYHFDLRQYRGEGLILYPHFSARVVAGWFDKFLPWRQATLREFDDLVLLCPSEAFVADLPFGKIPDRGDFNRLPHAQRVSYWEECVGRSRALAEAFAALVEAPDPLAGVTVFE